MKSKQGNPPEVTPKLLSRAAGAAVSWLSLAPRCGSIFPIRPDRRPRPEGGLFKPGRGQDLRGGAAARGPLSHLLQLTGLPLSPTVTVHQSRCLEPGESLKRPRCC